jgi:lysophospholipase L1-like esterase
MPGGFYVMTSDGVGWPPWEEFNFDGLRDRTRTKERPDGYRRIAFLGDSVTLGAEVTPSEAYPQLLEAAFAAEGRRTEVMSVALWGWSTRQERTAWQKIARGYHPDQAVLGVCLNDIPELQNNLARPPRWLATLHEQLALVRLLINPQGREIDSVERLFAEADSPRVQEALARFFDEVRALRAEVEAEGATFALLVFPFRFQLEPDAPKPIVQDRIAGFCRDQKLACLDLPRADREAGRGSLPRLRPPEPDGAHPRGRHAAGERPARRGRVHPTGAGRRARRRVRCRLAGCRDVARGGVTCLRRPRWLRRWRGCSTRPNRVCARRPPGDSAPLERPRRRLPALSPSGFAGDDAALVRAACARALGLKGARGGVPALLEALGDSSESVRAAAAQSLFRVGPTALDVAPLTAALASPDRYVSAFAAWSLGNLGAAARGGGARAGEGARARRDQRRRRGGAGADRAGRGGGRARAREGARQPG